jgi:hypothetical protein
MLDRWETIAVIHSRRGEGHGIFATRDKERFKRIQHYLREIRRESETEVFPAPLAAHQIDVERKRDSLGH